MSLGALLVGAGAMAVVIAYVVRPFRGEREGSDLDRAIEAWIAQARSELAVGEESGADRSKVASAGVEASVINFCSECGRKVARGDRFCPGCGSRLRGEGE